MRITIIINETKQITYISQMLILHVLQIGQPSPLEPSHFQFNVLALIPDHALLLLRLGLLQVLLLRLQRGVTLPLWGRLVHGQFALPALLVGLVLLFAVQVERLFVALLLYRYVLVQLLLGRTVLLDTLVALLMVALRLPIDLAREIVQQHIVLLVERRLVVVHLDLAFLLQLDERRLVLAPHPLVAGHLLVHLLLHMLLLLLGDDAGGANGGEVGRSVVGNGVGHCQRVVVVRGRQRRLRTVRTVGRPMVMQVGVAVDDLAGRSRGRRRIVAATGAGGHGGHNVGVEVERRQRPHRRRRCVGCWNAGWRSMTGRVA